MLKLSALFTLLPCLTSATIYELVQKIAGNTFLDSWDYVDGDNIHIDANRFQGAQNYVNGDTSQQLLTFTDGLTGHTIIKVDNTTNLPYGDLRNSIKIITKATYPMGSVWMIDLFHVPYGCGVQPVFWSMAPTQVGGNWPKGGQRFIFLMFCYSSIGTFEALNKEVSSQMMLYTEGKCNASSSNPNQNQASIVNTTDCSDQIQGCATTNGGFPSYGPEFNNGRGGVYITELASTGISIWYFPRNNVPPSMLNSTSINTTEYGIPVANWPASICGSDDFTEDFLPQSLMIEIALCSFSDASSYNRTCPPGDCWMNSIAGNGSNFAEAYFEIGSMLFYNASSISTNSTGTATTAIGAGKDSSANKHKRAIIGIITGSICGFLTIVVVALLAYKKRKNTLKSEGESPFPVPFYSTQQGNIGVLHNLMHALPQPKSPIRKRAVDFNSAELDAADEKTRPPSATASTAPVEIAELMEENDMLRRRLAEVTESVAGGTPPPTYNEDDEHDY
ncbi:hypothetical protein BDQ17DRAFT_1311093, partial [Cyathus striatus]